MKNVLIPTDLTLRSLDLVTQTAQVLDEKMNVILFHAFDMPDSMMDIVAGNRLSSYAKYMTEEMRVKCKRIKALHNHIQHIHFRCMYGSTMAAFKNYAEANKIDLIVLPEGYRFNSVVRDSVDMVRILERSGIDIIGDLTPPEKYAAAKLTPARVRQN